MKKVIRAGQIGGGGMHYSEEIALAKTQKCGGNLALFENRVFHRGKR